MIFVFIYGILNGGFHYVFKMYIFDISQSRNFNRTWPVVQAVQGFGALIGKIYLHKCLKKIGLVHELKKQPVCTVGVKIRNLKVDFNTGGAWCQVGQ